MEKTEKIALVTGANRGIGFEISRQLCFKGFKVYMASRNKSRIEQSSGLLRGEGHHVEAVVLDVTDQASINSFQAMLMERKEKLQVLINNAAILKDDSTSLLELPQGDVLATFTTNTLAPLIVTRTLMPLLASGSRVIMLSSGAGAVCGEIGSWAPIYSMSKTALNAITRQLAPLLKKENIAVNAVCPGWVKTEMGGQEAPRSVGEGAQTPVWLATEADQSETGKFWRDKKEISW